jgi:uncharacterized damage-inducible protein DinB
VRSPCTLALVIAALHASPSLAQEPPPDPGPMTRALRMWWGIADYVVRLAEAMPGDRYSFKPFADMRSFGGEIGHVADEHYLRCSQVLGQAPPATAIEGTVTAKDDLVRHLRASVAYCDAVYDAMTDADLAKPWRQGRSRGVNLGPLVATIAHDNEHWGILVMLMRMSGVEPPRLP